MGRDNNDDVNFNVIASGPERQRSRFSNDEYHFYHSNLVGFAGASCERGKEILHMQILCSRALKLHSVKDVIMQGASTTGCFPGLKSAVVASVSRLADGGTLTASLGFCVPRDQGLHVKSILLQRRWSDKPIVRTKSETLRINVVRADATTNGTSKPIAPLRLESPRGQFLAELLHSHPHLFSTAVEQQLEKLAEDRDVASGQETINTIGDELVLYKRIAELRADERRNTLEEIMYALVSQRFVEAGISMVPKIFSIPGKQRLDNWPPQDKELESVHSNEALKMIQEHLALVLGVKGTSDSLDKSAMARISKLRMGQVYAASVVYGYFLRRVDQRFQLEKTLTNSLPLIKSKQTDVQEMADNKVSKQDGLLAEAVAAFSAMVVATGGSEEHLKANQREGSMKPSRLRAYVMSFDAATLHRYATIRSKESASIIERHTEALFGRPEIQITRGSSMVVAKDEVVLLSFSGLRRLVSEAVAFGSFLWDVETYVDTQYSIVSH